MSLYQAAVVEPKRMLNNLDAWLDKAVAHAKEKSFDPSVLLAARLVPDMFAFTRQVQSACDAAKFAPARITGKQPPSHPDTEQTLDELKARIKAVTTYLDTYQEADFKDADGKLLELSFLEGKVLTAADYLYEMALPNFFFHVTTAYAILRHNGVPLGKRDYLGPLTLRDKK